MKLFYTPGACSLSPHIVLNELDLPYTVEKVDLKTHTTASGADFYTLNAKGYVPALQLDSGEVLTEGPAIIQYLADQKPQANLLPPAGSLERARVQEWLNFIGTEVHKTLAALFNPSITPEAKSKTIDTFGKRLGVVEKALQGKDYLTGKAFSVADAYLFTIVNWAPMLGIDLSPWPTVVQFQKRVASRPAVQKTLQAEGLI
ncbi:TPA: glutathione transferase GstA [Pseudomonas putida]|jgi:glutathione S-transferase|uniref:glutathione transferase GstA n=1 Tax=Pseudomonas TaxID=286 RepID=UPI000483C318|nr:MULTISPECIES: glutathione transferase GstA [Pseudomonas]MDD2151904.1 glutathione transferase GstA [Pseudomonas putida]RAS30642.1 glutathione S-transferase [Pseudomonas sp. URMO17WK12:I7]SMF38744.1 glutathione S-transferase [Pseudomonas sp. URMO17WK12:I5]HDS1680213.1 glutathione transferase GstA [Pseudomonas putida]